MKTPLIPAKKPLTQAKLRTAKDLQAELKAKKKPIFKGDGAVAKQQARSAASKAEVAKTKPKPVKVITPKGKVAQGYVPGSGDADKPFRFPKGVSGNPAGPKPGLKTTLSEAKLRWCANTGMSPIEFLTFVYRDELYEEYEVQVVDIKSATTFVHPKIDEHGVVIAKRIQCTMPQRLAAATAAAPYIHRKKPIGIDGGEGKPISFVSADQLANLSEKELNNLLEVMDKLGIGGAFEGHKPTRHSLDDKPE